MLTFGTAGIRGPLGPGENQMNLGTVIRTTAGLMEWLTTQVDNPHVVIGCDGRHGSRQFYQAVAQVVAATGGTALCVPPVNPTPLTAFSVKHLHADAGVMITASHNPATDNGYKVYLGGRIATGPAEGVQLIPPADSEIAAAISTAPFADEIPRVGLDHPGLVHVDPRPDYISAAHRFAARLTRPRSPITIALTAMHGVGGQLAQQVLSEAGFTVSLVPQQAAPDPGFPTVTFPNPEEPGALDLAMEHATHIGADLIIALDPDADRCAVAIPEPGGWRQLSGDETGCLLAEYLITCGVITPGTTVASSIVSSRQLGTIAARHGITHRTTLTGFKWIARTPGLSFGYEEAIGYCCNPSAVADKDGITAALAFAHLVAYHQLTQTDGGFATAPLTIRVDDPSIISATMARLRAHPLQQVGGVSVTTYVDFLDDESRVAYFGADDPGRTDAILLLTAADERVIIRPSGTEPKLKCYLDVPA